MKRYSGMILGLAAALTALLAINLIASLAAGSAKIDMTEEDLYTLSPATKKLLGKLDQQIKLKFFYSRRALSDFPQFRIYGDRVTELLREYQRESDGNVVVEIYDPRPFSEAEELALGYGLQAQSGRDRRDKIYFGLVGVSESGEEMTIPFLDPAREQYLEYDLSSMIDSIRNPEKAVIGVMSALPVLGGVGSDPLARLQQRAPSDPWVIASRLQQDFDVREIAMNAPEIEEDVDLLIVVHPKNVSPAAEYAIDQFLMRGGRAILAVDGFSHAELSGASSLEMNQRFQMNFESTLPKLFEAWGIEQPKQKVLGDLTLAMEVNTGQSITEHPLWLNFGPENMSQEEIVTSDLESLLAMSAAPLSFGENAPYDFVPLVETSDRAGTMDSFMIKLGVPPDNFREDFEPGDKRYGIAWRATGKFKTAFPNGPPSGAEADADAHRSEVETETTVILMADADMLADISSVNVRRILGQRIAVPFNDNLNFFNNAVDQLTGASELIELRTRGKSNRPFTLVNELERQARAEYQAEEQALQQKLEETNQRIRELEQAGVTAEGAVASQDLVREIENFREELRKTEKRLWEVRGNLREDVEALGTRLKLIHIVAVPLLVVLLGFVPALIRTWKMRAKHG